MRLLGVSMDTITLLPIAIEEKEVLGVDSIPVAIPPSCQDMKTIAEKLI